MTLGTGIFLSAALLGLIILFNATKDRWDWKRIMKWVVITAVAVPGIGLGLLWADNVGLFEKSYWERPSKQTVMWGIELGTDKDDVLFLKGKPERSYPSEGEGVVISSLLYPNYWVDIDDEDKVNTIVYRGKSYGHNGFFGIKKGTTLETLIDILGEPDFIANSDKKDEHWRRYEYYGLNLLFVLEQGEVESYGIRNFSAKVE